MKRMTFYGDGPDEVIGQLRDLFKEEQGLNIEAAVILSKNTGEDWQMDVYLLKESRSTT